MRQHQDLTAFWRDRDRALILELSKPEPQSSAARIEAIRRQIADTERKLADVSARLQRDYPDFSALANPRPLKVEDIQRLLAANEALVFLQTGERESYVFALTRDAFDWRTIASGRPTRKAPVPSQWSSSGRLKEDGTAPPQTPATPTPPQSATCEVRP